MERKERILIAFGEKGPGRQYTIGPDCKIGSLPLYQVQLLDTHFPRNP